MHRITCNFFGLSFNNYIGSLPQSNKLHKSFIDFFIYERLEPLVRLAERKKIFSCSDTDYFENLYVRLPHLLPQEKPALLHGDLWNGNIFSDEKNNPVIFDPAIYFGNKEAELAFTKLFGGFDNVFYDAYFQENPLLPGYEKRFAIYNLYPLLVHLHLFGESYYAPIIKTLKQFA
jgi:fructosamine-3-kinase